jgi:hypothetical protein
MDGGGGGPDWLGLLKWSLAHSDGTTTSEAKEMSEEDKKWLEKVMLEGLVKDEPAKMKEIMMELVGILDGKVEIDSELAEKLLYSLEDLRNMVDQIDMAQVFTRFGGLKCLMGLLQLASCPTEVREMSASVIGCLCQNNIKVQDDFYGKGALNDLVRVYVAESSPGLKNKILFAISCLVRSHAALEESFVSNHIDAVIRTAIQYDPKIDTDIISNSARLALMKRGLFLSNALVISDYASAHRVTCLVHCLIPAVASLLSPSLNPSPDMPQTDLRETLLQLLLSLSRTEEGHRVLSAMGRGETVPAVMDRALTSQPGYTVFMNFDIDHSALFQQHIAHRDASSEGQAIEGLVQDEDSLSHELSMVRSIQRSLSQLSVAYPPPPLVPKSHSDSNVAALAASNVACSVPPSA